MKQLIQKYEKIEPTHIAKVNEILTDYLFADIRHGSHLPKIRVTVDNASGLPAVSKDVYGDILITRHKPGNAFYAELQKVGVSVYVMEDIIHKDDNATNELSHLENVALAEELGLKEIESIPESLPKVYKSRSAPCCAVIAVPEPDRLSNVVTLGDLDRRIYYIFRTRHSEPYSSDLFDIKVKDDKAAKVFTTHMNYSYGGPLEYDESDADRISTLRVKAAFKEIKKIAVSSCYGFKPEFIKQVNEAGAQVYISSGINTESVKLADDLGITILGITDYVSHVPFMKRMVEALRIKGFDAHFIPRSFLW